MKLVKPLLMLLIIAGVQGCSLMSDRQADAMAVLQITAPLPIDYKNEIALARLTEVLQRAEITDLQRAQLYYDRGVIYDAVGLRSLARLDFNRALSLKPDLVEAYNFIGIHFTQLQAFTQAYDAFDSALELAPKHEYAYLNRGIALYYGDRAKLAIDDLKTFYEFKQEDAYRVLWLYFAELAVAPEMAKNNLINRQALIKDDLWGKYIISLYLGEVSAVEFLQNVSSFAKSQEDLTHKICEAYFYLGKFNQFKGHKNLSNNFFKLTFSTHVYDFVEYRYAQLELDLIATKAAKVVEVAN